MLDTPRRSKFDIDSLFYDFGVKSESELYDRLVEDSITLPCICCKKEYPFEYIRFIDENPYCINCLDAND